MRDITRYRLLCAMVLCSVTAVRADVLSEVPDALAGRLHPVVEVSVDMLDTDAREQLTQARQTVVDAIDRQQPDAVLADAYGELAALYQVQHVFTAADLCYRNARTLTPDNFRWTYLHAYLAGLNGETEQAIERYELARRLRPDYLAVTLRLADAWRDLNEQDKAVEAYQQVISERGLDAAALYGLGQIELLQRRNADAIEHFEAALALQPEATRIHYSLAQALRTDGREEEARQHLQQLGDRLPTVTDPLVDGLESLERGARVYFSRGMKAIKAHDYTAARDAFAGGLEREPDNIEARISYARALYLSGDSQQAARQLEEALQRAPDNTLALFLLGVLAEETGDSNSAMVRYRRVLALDAGHAGANFYLANQEYRQGHTKQAANHYAATIAADPDNLAAYLPYIGILMQSGRHNTEAASVIESAQTRFAGQPVLRYLQIQQLACHAPDPGCDPGTALTTASELVAQQPAPPHRELLALATAVSGDYKEAARLQESLISDAVWMMPTDVTRLRDVLSAYQDGELPAADKLFTWTLMQPPRTRATDVFRDYPTPKPY